MPLDKVMELLDDNAEAIKMGKEINDMIVSKAQGETGVGSAEYDDDILLQELQAMMESPAVVEEPPFREQVKTLDLPDAPTHDVFLPTESTVKARERKIVLA